jgi:hypothetical protein
VVCVEACIDAAGPPPAPPADAQPATPDDVDVSVEVTPPESERARLGDVIAVTILAHNASTHPIVVTLPSEGGGPPLSFSYRLALFGYELTADTHADDAGVTVFAAGETKRFVFDVFGNAPELPNGLIPATYQVYGAYGRHWSTPATMVVAP